MVSIPRIIHCQILRGKYSRVRFELFTNIDVVMIIERDICDGLSQYSGKYMQANNKYMFVRLIETIVVSYIDVNNLYGWTMFQPLPAIRISMDRRLCEL